MSFTVEEVNGIDFSVEFRLDDDLTFCVIKDDQLDVVVAAHSLLGPNDDYDLVEGAKQALNKALLSPPVLFDKYEREVIWAAFWEYVYSNEIFDLLEEDEQDYPEDAEICSDCGGIIENEEDEVVNLIDLFNDFEERLTALEEGFPS